tara:strand:- start:216 stop:1277 length:1062 start_codon:yes stop_codon:yes gene_type:complete
MKPRTFTIFAGLTAVAVVAAVVAVSTQPETTSLTAGTEPAFPKLSENVNDVAKVEIKNSKGSFSISRDGEKWGLDQKDGYTVEFEKIKSAIVAASNFKLIERKTSDPERYGRLDLNEPTSPEAKSTRIVFRDSKGEVLADALIGKLNANLFGNGGAGTYIRRGDEKATWLVRGQIQIGEEPNNWMARQIVNYGQENIRHVDIKRPDGATFSISKEKKEDRNFVLAGIPEGRQIKNADEANPLGGVTWRMMFDDVTRADKQAWPADPWVAHYTTWEGVTVRIETAKIGDNYWGRFRASVADDVSDPEAKKAAQATVDEINARTDGWSYMLTAGDAEKLTSKIEDYLAEPKKEGS